MSTTHKIVSRWNSEKVLFECEVPADLESGLRTRYVLEKAVSARANLAGANLARANLAGALTACLIGLLVLSLSGCGGGGGEPDQRKSDPTPNCAMRPGECK